MLEDLSAAYPPAVGGMLNIGLLHTCATGREGHQPYAPCTIPGLISKHYDYWALGHAHGHEVLNREPEIIFSGNVQGRHIHEHGPKGCMLVHVDAQQRLRPELAAAGRVPLADRAGSMPPARRPRKTCWIASASGWQNSWPKAMAYRWPCGSRPAVPAGRIRKSPPGRNNGSTTSAPRPWT